MKGPQGVILFMVAGLVLWFTWSSNSPFRSKSTATPSGDAPGGGTLVPGDGNTPKVNPHGGLPAIPPEILPGYTECISNGGTWDFAQNKCTYKG